jgi:CheY-like chemotaxis protein
MDIKQALVVDDSKSARLVLKRMLNDVDIEVDMVESALDAMDYLEGKTPDVIFMDHMMPGMDGFEAVKHIKQNQKTAAIPIMMYTSRGGDVYLSQARELGAVGVIPKTISPMGLKASLFKLGLVKDRRVNSSLQVEDRILVDRDPEHKPLTADEKRQIEESLLRKQQEHESYIDELRKLMDDQTIELHKSMWLGIESVSNEIFNRLNSELEQRFNELGSSESDDSSHVAASESLLSWPMVIVGTLLIASMLMNITLLMTLNMRDSATDSAAIAEQPIPDEDISKQASRVQSVAPTVLTEQQYGQQTSDQPLTGQREADQRATGQYDTQQFIRWAQNREIEYPFDELALNENRLPSIEKLIQRAAKANYRGSINLQTHVGRFCLSRDADGNYQLAKDDIPVAQCEYIGSPVQPYDDATTHQSLAFANYLSDLGALSERGIVIDVTSIPRAYELSEYPKQPQQATVEEWNLAAKLNNRITIKLTPEGEESAPGSE